MLARLHEGHAGIEQCRLRAKEVMYWPNMNKAIETHLFKCPLCVTYLRANQAEPVIEYGIPNQFWSKIGTDVLEFGGCSFLIVVDYYSKYHEVHQLSSKMATGIVNGLKPMFARHGIPDSFVSDNIPFVSEVFQEFGLQRTTYCSSWLPEHAIEWYIILTRAANHEQASERTVTYHQQLAESINP